MSDSDNANKPSTDLGHEEVDRLLRLIDESHYDEVRLEVGGCKLYVRKTGASGSGQATTPPAWTDARAPNLPERGADVGTGSGDTMTSEPASSRVPETASQAQPQSSGESIPEGHVAVRSPLLGAFYRSPSPGSPPFAEPGQKVAAEDTVFLVEVMKLFNSVEAGTAGTVVKYLVGDGELVEHGQAVLLIKPHEDGGTS